MDGHLKGCMLYIEMMPRCNLGFRVKPAIKAQGNINCKTTMRDRINASSNKMNTTDSPRGPEDPTSRISIGTPTIRRVKSARANMLLKLRRHPNHFFNNPYEGPRIQSHLGRRSLTATQGIGGQFEEDADVSVRCGTFELPVLCIWSRSDCQVDW
jgi:hypothetical protein